MANVSIFAAFQCRGSKSIPVITSWTAWAQVHSETIRGCSQASTPTPYPRSDSIVRLARLGATISSYFSSGAHGLAPGAHSFTTELVKGLAADQVGLGVKGVEIAAWVVRNRWAEAWDLNPCIFRSRLRIGRCEFSARLFSRNRPGW